MSKRQKKFIYYIISGLILSLIIYLLPINNIYTGIPTYILFILYFVFNYFNDKKYKYKRELYILCLLMTILYNIFYFSILSLSISTLMTILLILQSLCIHKKNCSKKENKIDIKNNEDIKKEEIVVSEDIEYDIDALKNKFSNLYIDMQKYYSELDYKKIKNILSNDLYIIYEKQMNKLESKNKKDIRDNIIINNIEILDFDDSNSKYIVKIDVLEDRNNNTYQSIYELVIINKNKYYIDELKLLYSKSKKS